MIRAIAVIASLVSLAACGPTNPFDESGAEAEDTSPNRLYATDLNEAMTMNALVYRDNGTADPTDDTLLVNNLPFDNSDVTGGDYTRAGALPNGFDRYESPVTGAAGERRYFAVFRRTALAQGAAVGTGDYVNFGFGGATAQRFGKGGLPAPRPNSYTFTGDYAAVRITTLSGRTGDVEFVTGDATLFVDILDFDVNGAVEGIVNNREYFDVNGNSLGSLGDYLSLATADIDFTNSAINASEAYGYEGTEQRMTGQWQGIFAGPNGEEIAGIVVLEGNVTSAEPDDTVRETGTLIVVNGG